MAFDLSTAKPVSSGFDISTAKPVGQEKEGAKEEPSILDSIGDFFSGNLRETEQQRDLPELQDSGILGGEDAALTAAITPALLTATDPNEIAQIISGNFPNVGVSYNKDNQGNVFPTLVNNETGAATIINRPGVSAFDWLQGIGIGAALAPTSKAATIPAIIGKAVSGESALQGIQAASGGEFDAEDVAIAGLGAGAIAGAIPLAKAAAPKIKSAADSLFSYQTPAKKRIASLLEAGSTDIETARYKFYDPLKLDTPTPNDAAGGAIESVEGIAESVGRTASGSAESGLAKAMKNGAKKVKKDPLAIEAIRQGFDEGVIAAIKGSGKVDKGAMNRMINITERGIKNKRHSMRFRATDVAGDTVMERVNIIKEANKKAGKAVDSEAKKLQGKAVDSLHIGEGFKDSLDEMGIKINDDLTLNFEGSDIEGLDTPIRAVNNVFNRISKGGTPDAFQLHRVKRFIDENVTNADGLTGLQGKTERVLMKLRKSIDKTLDDKFPAYDSANKAYSETINAIDTFQGAVGKGLDLAGENPEKATGTVLRRIMSNAQSRVPILEATDLIEAVSKKYDGFGGPLRLGKAGEQGDLLNQILFADELDSVFGATARTSLKGQAAQATKQTAAAAASKAGLFQAGVDLLGKGAEKARGINQDAAFESIRELLKAEK